MSSVKREKVKREKGAADAASPRLPVSASPRLPVSVPSVFVPYPYQRLMAESKSRFAMWRWSRQVGKSMGAAMVVNLDILETEAQGHRTQWTLISRSLAQARELARKVRDVGRAVMMARRMLRDITQTETADSLEERQVELGYPGGSRVIVVSGNPDAAAGYTGNVLWDEVGLTKRARELFGTAFPVVSRGAARFWMTSTPRPGFWKQRWDQACKPDSAWDTHTLTILDAVKQGCPMNVEELRAGLADDLRWRQEYLCEDVDDDVCWLPWELIVAATDPRCTADAEGWLRTREAERNRALMLPAPIGGIDDAAATYAGWDVARWNHLSVLVILHRCGGLLLTRGVLVMKRMPFEQQIALVSATLKRMPRLVRLCIDATGMGEMVAEVAKGRIGQVEAVKATQQIKEVMAGDLRRVLEDRTLRLPDDDELRADLHSVHRTATAAGNPRFEGEIEGSHADRFWALAHAVHAAIKPRGGGMVLV